MYLYIFALGARFLSKVVIALDEYFTFKGIILPDKYCASNNFPSTMSVLGALVD